MNDADKLRIMWENHNKQLDENRAVNRALEDIRTRLRRLENKPEPEPEPEENGTVWVKRQKPQEKGGNWIGQPWPESPWALFKDVYGQESLAQRITNDDYEFSTNDKIDLKKLIFIIP